MTYKIMFFLITTVNICFGQDYASIDDIPIESYDHGDHQDNHMDLELLPRRQGRTFSSEEDPKDFFFRSMRSFDDEEENRPFGPYQYLSRPDFHSGSQNEQRKKRSAADPVFIDENGGKSLSGIVRHLGKPLEVVPLDAKNLTEKETKAESRQAPKDKDEDSDAENINVNDFIRFRRSTEDFDKNNDNQNIKLFMESSNDDITRAARGATKEHWTKQIYPVRRSDDMAFDDNVPFPSESPRTPRVHFVSSKFADGGSGPTETRPYEREARSRSLERIPSRDLGKDPGREVGRETQFYERRFRPFMPHLEEDRSYYRDEMYPRYDARGTRDVYPLRYENYDRIRNDYPPTPHKPQNRIIYYATLPEINRSPSSVDTRDRYRYERDRFDDRYLNDPYRFRKTYPKLRYEDEGKTPYPIKVLTDVNVREVKKNPERRIYSEVDRSRYAYNTPNYRESDG